MALDGGHCFPHNHLRNLLTITNPAFLPSLLARHLCLHPIYFGKMTTSHIHQRMAAGIVWMIGARLLDRSIGIISTLILARLLVPGDFGLVAMATAIGGMLDLLGSFNFDLALIQKKDADRRHYDTVWTFSLISNLTCAAGMVLLAVPAAQFYDEPRLVSVMYVLSLSYILNSVSNVGVVNFRKELQFHREFIYIFSRRLVSFVVTVVSAYLLRTFWALLLGICVGRALSVCMSYCMNSYRPRLSLAAARELLHFSKWMMVTSWLAFLRHDGCTFVIGRMFGATGLGVFSVSQEISNLPSTELVAPINRVTFPGFAEMAKPQLIAHTYLRLLGMIALVILPVGIGIAAIADPLVRTMLGPQWGQAIPLISVLAISGALTATQANNSPVWLALGRPHEVAIIHIYYVAILFLALYFFLTAFGMVGVAYAYLLTQCADVFIEMRTTKRLLSFSWCEITRVVWRPVVGVIVMYASVGQVDHFMKEQLPLVRMLVDAGVGMLTYCVVVMTLWCLNGEPDSAETFCLKRLKLLKEAHA